MRSLKDLTRSYGAIAVAVLSGCGGGGGSSTPATESPPPSVQAPSTIPALKAWQNFLNVGGTWTMTGTGSDGASYAVSITAAPAGDVTLGAATLRTTTFTLTTRRNGQLASTDVVNYHADKSTGLITKAILLTESRCVIASSSGNIPATATVNTSGLIFSGTKWVYQSGGTDCTTFVSTGTYTVSWSYEPDSGIPMLCVNISNKNTLPAAPSVQASCVEVLPDGGLGTRASIASSDGSARWVRVRNF